MAFPEHKLNLKVQQSQLLTPIPVQLVTMLQLHKLELSDMTQQAQAKAGYVRQDFAIALIEKAGFKLAGASEVNSNPNDTKDYPEGVWTLPPTDRLGDKDRAKYQKIGESDRFTLKFVKQ